VSLLLNIDTATDLASVCVSQNGSPMALKENQHQREHASFIHVAIEEVLKAAGVQLADVDAFAVTSGPGSYTGLRVGMATAKGFCYAFSKPLISINTLKVMAQAAIESLDFKDDQVLLCPMIEARRMEVFTAIFDQNLHAVLSPQPFIVDETSFDMYLASKKLLVFGSGSNKFKSIKTHHNLSFENIQFNAKHLATLAEIAFQQKIFSDVTYSEPEYFKEFYTIQKS
jgi:tRNA threonylcarbamoyladenosine biosynthesis protein TsaB